jgi:hypothetical protein
MTCPAMGPLSCTRGQHWAPREQFRLRAPGRLHSWCADCKHAYDRVKVARKRRVMKVESEAANDIGSTWSSGVNSKMQDVAKWIGTGAGVSGAVLIALNVGLVGYGFVLFLLSSVLWLAAAVAQREPSLAVLQGTFTVINVIGLWRWGWS